MLTKKDYMNIATLIKFRINMANEKCQLHALILDLATYFEIDNPNFDRQKFIIAAGGSDKQ